MSNELIWADGRAAVGKSLREAHRRRHREARIERRLKAAAASARTQRDREADRERERGAAAVRRKRKRQEAEELRDGRRLRAALAKAQRQAERDSGPPSFYQAFEAEVSAHNPAAEGPRDLYYDVISRGFDSGRSRTDAGRRNRNSARTSAWSGGEMAGKIGYVASDDALEDVAGSIINTMGDDIEEAKACAAALEELAGMSRTNAGVYKHVIIALPHQLTPEQRVALLQDIARPAIQMGLPLFAGLHKPNPDGDDRNFHAHLIVSLRPMTRHGPYDWSFSPSKLTWLDTPEGLLIQRRIVASAINSALARAGHDVRWTAKSREDRGLPSPGNNKKGQEKTRAERAMSRARAKVSAAEEEVQEVERHLASIDRVESVSNRLDAAFSRHVRSLQEVATEPVAVQPARPPLEDQPGQQAQVSESQADEEERQPSSAAGTAPAEPAPADPPRQPESACDNAVAEPEVRGKPATEAEQATNAAEEAKVEQAAKPAEAKAEQALRAAEALKAEEADRKRRAEEAEAKRRAEEAERKRRADRRRKLALADERAASAINELRLTINDLEAFERLRSCLRNEYGGGFYASRTPRGDCVISSCVRGQIDDAEMIGQCEAGRIYFAAVADHLGPPPERPEEPLSRTEVPAPRDGSAEAALPPWLQKPVPGAER